METIEQEATAPKPLWRLNLDHDSIFWGAVQIDADAFKAGDVLLDHCPDNPPGRYRWDGTALVALPASQVKSAPEAPSLAQAFHHLVESLVEAGHALPPAVHAWAKEFQKTLDAH